MSIKNETTLENSLASLKAAVPVLEELSGWNAESIRMLSWKIEEMQLKNSQMLWPIRTAVSGKELPWWGIRACRNFRQGRDFKENSCRYREA